MSKRIATISYEKEITDIEYDNLFNSLKSYEKNELFCNFKGQISKQEIETYTYLFKFYQKTIMQWF